MMNSFSNDGSFCGKRRQPFDDVDSGMETADFGQQQKTSSVFPSSNSTTFNPGTDQGMFPAPVSSFISILLILV